LGQKGLSDPHQRDFCISHAESKEEWINLGARIHVAFGPFVAVGIRIGLDGIRNNDQDTETAALTLS
jgi:hypothetical protein